MSGRSFASKEGWQGAARAVTCFLGDRRKDSWWVLTVYNYFLKRSVESCSTLVSPPGSGAGYCESA